MALSTGTRRVAEIGCLIAQEPVLLLLDEPTSGIAQRETEALGQMLRNVKQVLDLTMVVIEHDMPMLMGLADRVVALETGSVLAVGSPAEIQANAQVISSYLGTNATTIERSSRALTSTATFTRLADDPPNDNDPCRATTRSGARCARAAGASGLCSQHRKVHA
jgi:ABC-type sulfate/molybdate transport systems ATPase subunit